jgi:hypothetical protein
MREESHLDDMRSAIRGDFERLAERRGGQGLMSVPIEQDRNPEAVSVERLPVAVVAEPEVVLAATEPEREANQPPAEAESSAGSEAGVREVEPEVEVEAATEREPDPESPLSADEEHEAPRRSWLDRLLGR